MTKCEICRMVKKCELLLFEDDELAFQEMDKQQETEILFTVREVLETLDML